MAGINDIRLEAIYQQFDKETFRVEQCIISWCLIDYIIRVMWGKLINT